MDFYPASWDRLEENNMLQKGYSIEKVGNEVETGDDELVVWARRRVNGFFLSTDTTVATRFADVSAWLSDQSYEPTAITTFLQVAGHYLITHALAHDLVPVAQEVPSDSLKNHQVPNACIGLGIKFVSPYEVRRHEKVRFILGGVAGDQNA